MRNDDSKPNPQADAPHTDNTNPCTDERPASTTHADATGPIDIAALDAAPTTKRTKPKAAGVVGYTPPPAIQSPRISAAKPVKNPRHEIFSTEIVKGTKPLLAYALAGYSQAGTESTRTVEAYRLLKHPRVAARISYLKQRALDETIITRAWLLHECQGTYFAAKEAGQFTPALKALEMLGREMGTFIPKEEHGKPGDFSHMTDDELNAHIARQERELSLGVGREAAASGSSVPRSQLN